MASRLPVDGTKDARRGLWLRLKNTCKQFKFSLKQILPTLFTLRDDESRIIAVMSSDVDDLLYGYLPAGPPSCASSGTARTLTAAASQTRNLQSV